MYMEKDREIHWNENGIKDAKRLHDNAFFSGFHSGRHKQRQEWANSGWVQIIPEKLNEVKQAALNPCINCSNRADYLKIGCKADPKKCSLKQKQILAIELLTYL